MKVWVMHGSTESGDDVGPYVFGYEPTTEEQIAILAQEAGHLSSPAMMSKTPRSGTSVTLGLA